MIKLVGLAGALVWAMAGVANMPHSKTPTTEAVCLSFAVSLALAYWCGTRALRNKSVAAAVARAEAHSVAVATGGAGGSASSAVNLNFITGLDPERGATARGIAMGLERAPWLQGAAVRQEIEGDALDVAMADVMEVREREEA